MTDRMTKTSEALARMSAGYARSTPSTQRRSEFKIDLQLEKLNELVNSGAAEGARISPSQRIALGLYADAKKAAARSAMATGRPVAPPDAA